MWTAENTYQMIKQILYNCEADCTVLIRKPQVISGGVRTPCTLPLDPPLYFKNRSNGPAPGIEPATSLSAVKRSTDWANPVKEVMYLLM